MSYDKERIQKFWEKCGFRYEETTPEWALEQGKSSSMWWLDPEHCTYKKNKLPPITLDNLFKYAVPKVYDMELIKRNRFAGEWQTAYRAKVRLARKPWQLPVTDKDPATALFLAIERVINENSQGG